MDTLAHVFLHIPCTNSVCIYMYTVRGYVPVNIMALNDESLVFDGRLVVDAAFQDQRSHGPVAHTCVQIHGHTCACVSAYTVHDYVPVNLMFRRHPRSQVQNLPWVLSLSHTQTQSLGETPTL